MPPFPTPDLLRAAPLNAIPWLRHAFSARQGGLTSVYGRPGELNLGYTKEEDPPTVVANREHLIAETGGPGWPLIHTRQVHSATILTIRPDTVTTTEPADGLITNLPNLFLGMLTADCVPVLLADTRRRAVGAFHAGWRGTAAAIVEKGVARMTQDFGSDPGDIVAAIGPSIGPCCYTVGEEVRTTFHQNFPYAPGLFQSDNLDLWEANRRQLLAAGLRPENVTVLAQCTSCTRHGGVSRFFSHRADHGVTGRMMALIGIAAEPLPTEIE